MSRLLRLFAGLILWVAVTPLASALDAELNALSVSNALGGQEAYAILQNADRATVQRVDSVLEASPSTSAPQRGDLVTLGEPFRVPAPQFEELKKILTSSSTYVASPKTCQFRANARYVFYRGKDSLAFILCFGCGEMEVWRGDAFSSFGPFDAAYGDLLTVTQALFPKDEFLAAFSAKQFEERVKDMRSQDKEK